MSAGVRKFWKPGTIAPGVNIERGSAGVDGKGTLVIHNPRGNLSLRQQRLLLPIYGRRRQLLYALEKYRVVVIVGETGSGKTTQMPQYLDEAGWTAGGRAVVCTQPRRIAAVTVARRVAAEMGATLGREVGYSVRFDDMSNPRLTRIKYATDGALVRECMSDPLLSRYSVVMIDEAHERSLATEILLGLLRKIRRRRPELRVIVASATLDARRYKRFFDSGMGGGQVDTSIIISVEGRCHPVDAMYSRAPVRDYVSAACDTALFIHERKPPGDILVFLTGRDDIESAYDRLRDAPRSLAVTRLYGGLSAREQERALRRAPAGCRKIILATNIAETSVTIEGVVYVVDCGFVKTPSYDPDSGLSRLHITPISRAQARQRAGRAGRVRAGACYRLFPEKAFRSLAARAAPEIQRTRLTSLVLQLKALGVDNLMGFHFLSPPPVELMADALELLFACGALDEQARLTEPVGTTMAEMPVDPCLARMLIASGPLACAEEALSVAAMLSVQSPFIRPRMYRAEADAAHRGFRAKEGDHLTLLRIYDGFTLGGKESAWCEANKLDFRALRRAGQIRRQLRRLLKRFGVRMASIADADLDSDAAAVALIKCVLSGYFTNVAQLGREGTYRTVRGGFALGVHPESGMRGSGHRWVMFHEVVDTARGRDMREVTAIRPAWLSEIAPHYYKYTGVDATRSAESRADSGQQTTADGRKFRRLF